MNPHHHIRSLMNVSDGATRKKLLQVGGIHT